MTNKHILIIDDNEDIHRDFRAILKGETESRVDLDVEKSALFGTTTQPLYKLKNFEVDSAFQGEEGLEKIRQALREDRPYAMAFVDIRMPPGWDGLETIRRVWREYPELQVVICTAYSDYSWHHIIAELGETEKLLILKKPFETVEVYQLASALTEKWRLSRQAKLKHEELESLVKQQTEKLVMALEDAQKADKAKSQFLANMSHEIRTPMNSVLGFSQLLADEELTDEQGNYVRFIQENGKHLLQLINDILDFSKIEAGQLYVERIQCSLPELLSSVESLMGQMAKEKSLQFEIIENGDLPAEICSDPTRLHQCLINLINNAIKFTEKGYVHLSVSIEYIQGEPFVRFDIEDTGIGIPLEKQKKIFESFTQADGATTRKYGGTGLGLSIARQLTEMMGGSLALTSEFGKGSVFSMIIPTGTGVEANLEN